MRLKLARHFTHGTKDQVRIGSPLAFTVRFQILIDDEGPSIGAYGMPYLAALWARQGLGDFDIDEALNRDLTRTFPSPEAATAFETELINACQADMHFWQQVKEWSQKREITLKPAPYPSEEGTGT